jgi:hypothetical protein
MVDYQAGRSEGYFDRDPPFIALLLDKQEGEAWK